MGNHDAGNDFDDDKEEMGSLAVGRSRDERRRRDQADGARAADIDEKKDATAETGDDDDRGGPDEKDIDRDAEHSATNGSVDKDDPLPRRLLEGGVILTLGPGLDYCHWTLVLNGTIYEMIPKDGAVRCFVRDGPNSGPDKSKAEYTLVGKNLEVKETRESIEKWMRGYELRDATYHMTKNNCQKFVMELGGFAVGPAFKRHAQVAMGNLLW